MEKGGEQKQQKKQTKLRDQIILEIWDGQKKGREDGWKNE